MATKEMNAAKKTANANVIKLAELLEGVELGKMPKEKAVKILRAGLQALGKRIAATESGVVRVNGLGAFRVRKGEKEKDGQKVATRAVVFKASKPKAALDTGKA
jgi:hypothetical protein